MKLRGFTLAEVLITLAIIGVVAAMTIPSVIVNTNQQEFKTGLRKAVSVLNSAITMNKALTGESPYDNEDLYNYLQQHMNVMKRSFVQYYNETNTAQYYNLVFYTADGMRFETMTDGSGAARAAKKLRLYESNDVHPTLATSKYKNYHTKGDFSLTGCGSMGLAHNPDGTTLPPCLITVDVNGDRKPNPSSENLRHPEYDCYIGTLQKYAKADGKLLSDIFSVMITDQGAVPYGVVAQKAMYQAQK